MARSRIGVGYRNHTSGYRLARLARATQPLAAWTRGYHHPGGFAGVQLQTCVSQDLASWDYGRPLPHAKVDQNGGNTKTSAHFPKFRLIRRLLHILKPLIPMRLSVGL
jgi:hypothetical protein